MSKTILFVNNDPTFFDDATAMLQSKFSGLRFVVATNRFEAIELLKANSSIEYAIMTLYIPRVSDAYIFFSHVANRIFPSNRIVVLAQNPTDQVLASVGMHGIEHILEIGNTQGLIEKIEPDNLTIKGEGLVADALGLARIQAALNEVMGPIGSFIFEKSCKLCEGSNDSTVLVDKIIKEIDDNELAGKFHHLCYA